MNREYNSRVSAKNSERLLKNLKYTTGDYFFLPHPVYTCKNSGMFCFVVSTKQLSLIFMHSVFVINVVSFV